MLQHPLPAFYKDPKREGTKRVSLLDTLLGGKRVVVLVATIHSNLDVIDNSLDSIKSRPMNPLSL